METVTDLILGAPKITADSDCSHEIKRRLFLGRKAMANVDNVLKSRDTTLPTKVSICTTMVFPSSHVWMWELDHTKGWALKNWCFWTVVLESLGLQQIKPVKVMLKLKHQYFGHLMQSPLIGKDPDAGKDWRQEEKGTTENEMVRWHHWLDGHESEQALGDSEGQGSLVCCSSWGCRVRHDLVTKQ